ncbi:MAG: AsmA family protein [Alphaproteobacteria bacterium]
MKKLLIGFAVLVTILIAGLVIGPSFFNWNDHKAEIIAAFHDATGLELAINGNISLKIIPAPALSVQDISLAGGAGTDAPDILTLKALEVRVALAPLISGEIQVTSVRLIQPHLLLEVAAGGRANWQFETAATGPTTGTNKSGGDGAGSPGLDLSLEKLAIEDATVIYRDHRAGTEERLENINLDGSAASLRGPFRFIGTATVGALGAVRAARDIPIGFDLSVDALVEKKPLGIRLSLKLADGTAQAVFSGRLRDLDTAPRLTGQLDLSAKSAAAVYQALLRNGEAPALLDQAVSLKTSVDVSAKAATLNDIDLAFGPMQGGGAMNATFGETPTYDLALAISRLDLDRLLEGAREDDETREAKPNRAKGPGRNDPTGLSIPPIPANLSGSVVITVEGLRYRGGVVSQVQLDASAENGILRLDRLSALLPGGSDLRLSGDAKSDGGVPRFEGNVELASNNLRGLLNWLDANPTAIPAGRLANMVLTTDFSLDPQQARITNLNLRLDSTTIEGAATILLQSRPSFGLALNVDRINLDGYLPVSAKGQSSGPTSGGTATPGNNKAGAGKSSPKPSPLAILEKFDANIVLNVGELAYNAAPIKGLSAELGLAAGKLTVRKAMVRNLAGANVFLSGSGEGFAGTPTGKVKVRLRAKYIDGLARLAGIELPVPPKRLRGLTVDGDIIGGGDEISFDLRTTLAGLKASLTGRAQGLSGQPMADLKFDLTHASLAALSRTFELGIKPLSRADTPLALSGSVKGGGGNLSFDLTANVAGAEIHGKGTAVGMAAKTVVDVRLDAAHKDLVSLLAALGQAFPSDRKSPGAVRISSTIKGGGGRYDLHDIKGTVGALDLQGKAAIDMAGQRPKLTAKLQAGDVVLDHFLGAAAPTGAQRKPSASKNQPHAGRGDGRWSREAIDLGALQALDADIDLTAKRLVFQRYPFEQPRLHLTLNSGVLKVENLTGRLFKGDVGLRATLNSRPLPGLVLSVQLKGADINQAMRTALEMDQVSGLLDFAGQFKTSGSSQWDLVNALSGQAKVHAANGVIRGFDLKQFSERLGRLNKVPDFLNLVQRAFAGGETKYHQANGTWNIRNGVAETQDMTVQLDAAQATVKGKVRLPAWNMDLGAVLKLTEHRDAPDMGVHLYGPLDQPRHDVKTAALERWLLVRLGRELLGKSSKTKGLGKFLEAVTGGGGSSSRPPPAPSGVQPTIPQPSQPGPKQPQQRADPTQQLIEGLFKALRK